MGLFSRKKSELKKDETPKEMFHFEPNQFVIPDSEIPENFIQEFISSVERGTKKILALPNYRAKTILYENNQDGSIGYFLANYFIVYKIKPPQESSSLGAQEEETLWHRIEYEGKANKRITFFEVVTNYRCFDFRPENAGNDVVNYIPETEVIVNNQRRISSSQRSGGFSGSGRSGMFVGSSIGFSTGESQTVGDVIIMSEGKIKFTFSSVADPHGLAQLIKHVLKVRNKINQKAIELDEIRSKSSEQVKNGFSCGKCGTQNPSDSKFCNKCGNKFNSPCGKCGKINLEGSSFCNSCGFALQ